MRFSTKYNALILLPLTLLVMAAVLGACSTTRRIPQGELLYTGLKKVEVISPVDSGGARGRCPAPVVSDLTSAVSVKPNNAVTASWRYPFPLGLWVYNNWNDSARGLKGWLYRKLVSEPVLVSDVRPEVRTKMLGQILDRNGYFDHSVSYTLNYGRNPKKASITYTISTGPEYLIDSVALLPDTCHLNHLIDSVARRSTYFRPGSRYCSDSLSQLRVDIANAMRNRGYYFFTPSYVQYLADSTLTQRRIAMKLDLASDIPPFARERYRTGTITTVIRRNQGGGTADTMHTSRGDVIVMRPTRLRDSLIPECIAMRPGRYLAVRQMNNTQTYLSRLGIFSAIEINARPDTTATVPTLNVTVDCTVDKPLEAMIEANVSSKSNSYLGPGLTATVTNRNVFGGGEQLSVSLSGSYEWQTGHRSSNVDKSLFNSYEATLTGTLAFPRLLAPGFIPRRRRQLNWTRIALSADFLNRPKYFRMAQFNTSFGYDWRVSRRVTNSLTLFKLTYTKLINTTEEFDSIMYNNPAIFESFKSQYIPQMSYTYNYSRDLDSRNTLDVTFTVQEAGNIFWSIYSLCGKRGEKELFGTPFSQFVKGTLQLVYGHDFGGDNWLVTRVAVGAAHAYGNSDEVPYSEQFYCGGANSVRAFTVRSLGPGSYKPPKDLINGYFDQTGTFKFEANVEYRFPLLGPLHGALFVDAGNVWLLKKDEFRPGGELRASTFLKDLALGTGVGLRLDISMLVLRGDLGIGIHAPYDTGKSGYYNMTSFGRSLAFHLAIGYPF